jgi:Domain of unknown function (DUF5666)
MTEPVEPVITSRVSGPNPIRVAIVAAVAIVLVLAAAITLAASPSAAPALGAGPSAAPAGSAQPQRSTPSGRVPGMGGFGGFAGRFGGFAGGIGGFGIGGATIAGIDGSNLSLKTEDGWTRTITVTSTTKITKAGQAIKLSDLKVGDAIGFSEKKASDGTYTIESIRVILPVIGGQISAISGNTITVKGFGGSTSTIHVTSSTTYRIAGNSKAKLSDLKVGMAISAEGTKNADGSLQAASVSGFDFSRFGPGPGHKQPGGQGQPKSSAAPSPAS